MSFFPPVLVFQLSNFKSSSVDVDIDLDVI